LPFGRQHWTWIDALRPRPKDPALAAEDGAERTLGNSRDLADKLELIILQPRADAGIELGQYLQRLRSEKVPLFSRGHVQL
jgi:hypothetical protein